MPCKRTAATLLTFLVAGVQTAGALAASSSIPQFTSTPPARLAATPSTPTASPAPAAAPGLPKTGDDLRIEGEIALVLLAAGGLLRRRRLAR